MPPTRSSFVVNHRIALSGSKARAAIPTHRVEYLATRPGAVRELTEDDEALANQARKLGIAGYIDRRPGAASVGGTALFDQNGPVSLAEARRRLAQADGAVCASVLSVRREDAEALGLADKESWERFVRANWPQRFAAMAGIPESRVGYVAAMHIHPKGTNVHVHVLSWDTAADDPWDSILPRRRMERVREELVSQALAPAIRRLDEERSLARDAAAALMRGADPASLAAVVELPGEGSLDYEHLRRFHPGVRERLDMAVRRSVEETPALREEVVRYRRAVSTSAELRGLESSERESYISSAERDLRRRLGNALLRAMRPDRSPAERPFRSDTGFPDVQPSSDRRRGRALAQELSAFLSPSERRTIVEAIAESREVPTALFRKSPSLRRSIASSGRLARRIAGSVRSSRKLAAIARRALDGGGKDVPDDPSEEAIRQTLRALSRIAAVTIRLSGTALRGGRSLARGVSQRLRMDVREDLCNG